MSSQEAVLKAEFKNLKLEIFQDQETSESPREWDNLGSIVAFYKDYNLQDENVNLKLEDFESWNDLYKYLKETLKAKVIIPLCILDHSGIFLKAGTSFLEDSQGWDTSRIGFIYVTEDKLKKEYSVKKINKAIIKKAEACLYQEVKTYSLYIQGSVYGFNLSKKKTCKCCKNTEYEDLDSCWGFITEDFKSLKEDVKDHLAKEYKFLVNKLI